MIAIIGAAILLYAFTGNFFVVGLFLVIADLYVSYFKHRLIKESLNETDKMIDELDDLLKKKIKKIEKEKKPKKSKKGSKLVLLDPPTQASADKERAKELNRLLEEQKK